MKLRRETLQDVAIISALITEAFASAPISGGNEAHIVDRLRAEGALSISLIAENEGQIVGHVAFSPVTISGAAGNWFGLGPVAVVPSQQRCGIGHALILEGLKELRNRGADGCVVLGDPAYYGRFGFTHDPALSYEKTGDHFQHLIFKGDNPSGEVSYHPAFGP